MVRLPTGQRVLANYALGIIEGGEKQLPPPNTKVMVTEDRIKSVKDTEEEDNSDAE